MDSESPLPHWLEEAKARIASRPHVVVSEDRGRLPRHGDVRLAESISEEGPEIRLVFVHRVQDERGTAEVVLLSNDVELASDTDIVVPAQESGLPFDLMVETVFRAPVWVSQIGRQVGRLDEGLCSDISRAMNGDVHSLPATRRGLPVKGRQDPRWKFRREEFAVLQSIASACLKSIIEGVHQPRLLIDPMWLLRRKDEGDYEWIKRLQLAARNVDNERERVEVPLMALERHSEEIRQTCDRLKEKYGCEVLETLRPLVERLGDDPPPRVTTISPSRTRSALEAERELETRLAAHALAGEQSVRLLTGRDAWTQSPESHFAMAMAQVEGSGRMRIECQFLEDVA